MFKDLLSISHADLSVVIDSHGKIISQTIYMFNDPDNKKILSELIDIKNLIPLVRFTNNGELNYYKIMITQEEFDLLK